MVAAAFRTAVAAAMGILPQELLALQTMQPYVQTAALAIDLLASAAWGTAATAAMGMLPRELHALRTTQQFV